MTTRIPFPYRIPFVERLGLELHGFGDGKAELHVDLDASLTNSWDVAHGGVLMTMMDVAMAHAARSAHSRDPARARGVVTIEMKTSFMRPGEGRLRAFGELLHGTATMAFCESKVIDAEGRLCAHATGTFKYLKGLPTQGGITRHTPNESPNDSPNPESDAP